MERARRVAALWSWLPAFRAVAETEHLPTAAREFRVTASSLSRTVRLLEEQLGQPLFERAGRSLRLNDAGRVLANAVRDAMRMVDEGLSALDGPGLRGPVHVSVPGPLAPLYVLPALPQLAEAHPHLGIHVHAMTGRSVNAALRRGGIDLAIVDDAAADDELTFVRLATLRHDVFVAPGRRGPVEELSFVAPLMDARGQTPDAWPLDRRRRVGLRVAQMQVAVEAVRSGRYAAVLPVEVGRHQGLEGLGYCDEMGTTTLHLVHRRSLPMRGRAEVVRDAVVEAAGR